MLNSGRRSKAERVLVATAQIEFAKNRNPLLSHSQKRNAARKQAIAALQKRTGEAEAERDNALALAAQEFARKNEAVQRVEARNKIWAVRANQLKRERDNLRSEAGYLKFS